MKKSILIISAGPGLSRSVAEKFGQEGFTVGMISFDQGVLNDLETYLNNRNIETVYAVADVLNPEELRKAIETLSGAVGGFDVVHYNAAVVKSKDILEETADAIVHDFTINAAHALLALQTVYPDLKRKKGSLLLTGGGLGVVPHYQWGSLSIGKAALRSLAIQLNERVAADGIYVGMLTIDGLIDVKSATHNPATLAEQFYNLYVKKDRAELHYSADSARLIAYSDN